MPSVSPDLAALVTAADVAWLPAGATRGALAGVARSATYDSVRWAVAGSQDLGLSIQWWRLPTVAEATGRFEKNLAGAPGAQAGTEVGSRSFRAPAYHHRELAFLDEASRSVIEIGCGDQTCVGDAGGARLLELAQVVRSRLHP